jgi:hypothetical protein
MNYGYKVYYREENRKRYIRRWVCNTYNLAEWTVKTEMRSPPQEWKILPITKKELQDIQKDCPFEFP